MDTVAPALANKPQLNEFSAYYEKCFRELNAMRSEGFNGKEKLKFSELLAYCELFEIDDREQFFYNMRAADYVYMEWLAKAKN